jgi:ribosomal protein S18 acetylase RimI-like enzyme
MTITKAQIEHLEDLIPLFDGYRIFYNQESNLSAEKHFLFERLKNKDSLIFIAYQENVAVGFTQLYPLFSSVTMENMYLLNDLFVDANFRGNGIGEALINEAKNHCIKNNLKGLAIQTDPNNPAQHLYQRMGFKKDTDLHFFWSNT